MNSEYTWYLSIEADKDLVGILQYTREYFGQDQAIKYLLGLEKSFDLICHNPEIGRIREDLNSSVRSYISQKHIVFYEIEKQKIRLVRIIHFSQEIPEFPEFMKPTLH